MANRLAYAFLLAGLLLVNRPATSQEPTAARAAVEAPIAKPILIGPGDLIDVTLFNAPELSGRFRVDTRGNVDAPLIGDVPVQGLTTEQAGKRIGQRYVDAQILRPDSAQVTVFIEEYASQGIAVNGEVKTPGIYPALGIRMLNDVITEAGGELVDASSTVLITRRSDPHHPISVAYNPSALKPVIPEIQINPGDSIIVPRAGIVYVVGDVLKPGGYVLDGRNTLTAEEAMGLAGGAGRAPSMHKVQLVRTLADGRKEMIIIPMNLVFKGKAADVALKDGDILYVPTSTARLATEQAIQSALGIATQVTVYKSAYE